jgi:hypothetical protein
VSALSLGLCHAGEATENPCTNGSFEVLAPNGFPVDWGPVGQSVSLSLDAYDGRYSLRLLRTPETKTPETGLNRGHRPNQPAAALIERLKGGVQFAYKAVSAQNAKLCIFVIPVNEQLVERTGSPRATFVVPSEHIGDGKWHIARLAYDYTDNPNVKYVHFAARIVGTAGELLLDSFAYLDEVGPILALDEPVWEEDQTRPGELGTVRVVIRNLGDRPVQAGTIALFTSGDLEVRQPTYEIHDLAVRKAHVYRWQVAGQRNEPGVIRVVARVGDVTTERSLRLDRSLKIRSFGPVQPVVMLGGRFTLECEVENQGAVILRDIAGRFDAGTISQTERVPQLAPGQRVILRSAFSADSDIKEIPLAVQVQANGLAATPKLESRIRVIPAVSLPAPAEDSVAQVSDQWARVESDRLRLIFVRETLGFGAGRLEVKDAKGRWQLAAWIPALGRLARLKSLGHAAGIVEIPLYANLPAKAGVAGGYAWLELPGKITDPQIGQIQFTVRFQLPRQENLIGWALEAQPLAELPLAALDGPMLYVVQREEAIFPGLEWLVQDEVSSDSLDIAADHPDRVRYVPHPQKITIPAVTFTGSFGSLAFIWDVHQKWDGQRDRPACVFASPDWLNNQRCHLVGLMLPTVPEFVPENRRHATKPYLWKEGQRLRLNGWVWADGKSSDPLEGIEAYLRLVGLPPMQPLPRGSYSQEIAFSMQGYLHSLWDEKEQKWWTSKNGGILSRLDRPPQYVADLLLAEWFVSEEGLRAACRVRAELGASLLGIPARWEALRFPGRVDHHWAPISRVASLLAARNVEGLWEFDADQPGTGPFEGMDYRKLGPDGAVEIGTCARRAYEVLHYARVVGDWDVYHQMLPTLKRMSQFRVPRAAQVWEIPVHTPDILAAADAVDAFLEAYQISGEEEWLAQAVLWARRGLPFVYLWDDPEKPFLQGASIPVFGATWYQGSWFGRAVQWNGLRYAESLLRLAEHDASLPWREIAERIVRSALYQQETAGDDVALWPDAISMITGEKVRWVFAPRQILGVILQILGWEEDPRTVAVGQPPQEIRITSLAGLSEVQWAGTRLSFTAQFRTPEGGSILIANLQRPTDVLLDGQPVPEDPRAEQSGAAAWRYDGGLAFLVVRVPGSQPVRLEISPAEFAARQRVPELSETISFDFDQSLEGWLPLHDIDDLNIEQGELRGQITGADPYLVRPMLRVPPDRYRFLVIRMRTTAGQVAQIFWTTEDSPNFDEAKSLRFRLESQGDFGLYRLDLGNHPEWRGRRITALRLDPGGGSAPAEFAVDYLRGE